MKDSDKLNWWERGLIESIAFGTAIFIAWIAVRFYGLSWTHALLVSILWQQVVLHWRDK